MAAEQTMAEAEQMAAAAEQMAAAAEQTVAKQMAAAAKQTTEEQKAAEQRLTVEERSLAPNPPKEMAFNKLGIEMELMVMPQSKQIYQLDSMSCGVYFCIYVDRLLSRYYETAIDEKYIFSLTVKK